MNTPSLQRILVVRPDRLGDVILSTPVFEALRQGFPNAHITVLVQEFVAPLLEGLDSVDRLIPFVSGRSSAEWARIFKEGNYDGAVILQNAHASLAMGLFRAGIPLRVGPLSRWYSWLFYNRGVRQRRSRVEAHEAQYNLQLLEPLLGKIRSDFFPRVFISPSVREQAARWLKENGPESSGPWIAVHPGMGGSALNWPLERYADLVSRLLDEGKRVLVTGGPADRGTLLKVRSLLGNRSVLFYGLEEANGVDFLGGLFLQMAAVVAPSTGPLHLASALGVPVLGFYPPIRVQSAKRWGPYGKDARTVKVLVPQVECEAVWRCRGASCPDYPCMEKISVDGAMEEVRGLLSAQQLP